MSKATEWWTRAQGRPEHSDVSGDPHLRAVVTEAGAFELRIVHFGGAEKLCLEPARALALARWILDTFGDGS